MLYYFNTRIPGYPFKRSEIRESLSLNSGGWKKHIPISSSLYDQTFWGVFFSLELAFFFNKKVVGPTPENKEDMRGNAWWFPPPPTCVSNGNLLKTMGQMKVIWEAWEYMISFFELTQSPASLDRTSITWGREENSQLSYSEIISFFLVVV